MKRANDVDTRIDANQRGRLAMDTLTRSLRSQVCLTPAIKPLVVAKATMITFYGDLRDNVAGLRPWPRSARHAWTPRRPRSSSWSAPARETADERYSWWATPKLADAAHQRTPGRQHAVVPLLCLQPRPPARARARDAGAGRACPGGHGPGREGRGPVQGQPVDHRGVREFARSCSRRHLLATGQPQRAKTTRLRSRSARDASPTFAARRARFLDVPGDHGCCPCSLFVAAPTVPHGATCRCPATRVTASRLHGGRGGPELLRVPSQPGQRLLAEVHRASSRRTAPRRSPVQGVEHRRHRSARWRNLPGSDAQYTVELLPPDRPRAVRGRGRSRCSTRPGHLPGAHHRAAVR